ncbi:site-2 protease family protein [Patescibacteria group bacterium]|nr:site-2 protease family protein [Patescibacteria group bacterium]MBU4389925.1 site-2 protease family protein [Patescibacteria group bacterium]MBU4396808.1 site-2 protease family protein [Patescibacteria group bacterium]MBU4431599.1 site-2 protease family protein [Patescibacteria group bacterium]MCG2701889.1 site-2 protease family protein [Candidatus Parcubacteria bacterium]
MLTIISIISLIIAITIHEFSHALMADQLGDPTPRSQDRLTLNPLKHLDPLGTLMLIFAKFGWGKPVPIDPYNLKNPRRDELLIAMAGPASNILLAILVSIFKNFLPISYAITYVFIATNISLAIFNLLPIPPLDGSKIFLNLLPIEKSIEWQQAFQQYGNFILIILLFLPFQGSSLINLIISPIIQLILKILL